MIRCLFLFILISGVSLADSIVANLPICEQILEREPDAIFFRTEERLYLRSDRIILTDQGLFVGSLPIPALYSDSSGCYVQVLSKSSKSSWICCTTNCPNFRNIFRSVSGHCPDCGRQGVFYQ